MRKGLGITFSLGTEKTFDLVHLLLLIPSLSTLNNFIMIVMFSFTLNILKYKIIFVLN